MLQKRIPNLTVSHVSRLKLGCFLVSSAFLIFLGQYRCSLASTLLCYDLQQLHVLQLPTWMAAGVCNVICVLRV